jgi:hypothetical protein
MTRTPGPRTAGVSSSPNNHARMERCGKEKCASLLPPPEDRRCRCADAVRDRESRLFQEIPARGSTSSLTNRAGWLPARIASPVPGRGEAALGREEGRAGLYVRGPQSRARPPEAVLPSSGNILRARNIQSAGKEGLNRFPLMPPRCRAVPGRFRKRGPVSEVSRRNPLGIQDSPG